MAVKGIFASDSGIVGDRPGDFASSLLRIDPTGSAPLLALSSGMKRRGATDNPVTWFEENHLAGSTTITNNAGTGTTITVVDASFIVPGAVVMEQNAGEHMFVLSVSGNDLTVERGFGGTTVAPIDGSTTPVPLQRLSTAQEEGSSKPVAVAQLGYPRWNYLQIFRNSWEVTETATAVNFHTEDQPAKNRGDAGKMHAEDIERAVWFQRKQLGVVNSKPFRVQDGVLAQITTNVQTQSTDVSRVQIDSWLQAIFERNVRGQPNERIAFGGNTALITLGYIAENHTSMEVVPGYTDYGFRFKKWITPFGDITIMTHPLFNENAVWTKDLHVLHPGAVEMRYLRNTKHVDNTQTPGDDARSGVWTTEMCITYKAEVTGGSYYGIDTAAAA